MNEMGHTGHISILPSTRQRPRFHVEPVTTLHPGTIKELSPFNAFPVTKEIVIFHDKNAIVLSEGHQNPILKAIQVYQTYAKSVI
jgi:hypothetical protein